MTEQTVDWAQFSSLMSRLYWRKFFYEMRGTGWVILLLFVLAIVDLTYLKMGYVWTGFIAVLLFEVFIGMLGYFSTRKFGRDIGKTLYSLDDKELKVSHQLTQTAIPLKNISKIVAFPEGTYVQYGPRLMLTLPNGPVQAELFERWQRGAL